MSSTYAEPLDRLDGVLDELAAIGPELRSTGEKREFLLRISRLISRAEGERLRVLAVSDDIAEVAGDRSTATWFGASDTGQPRDRTTPRGVGCGSRVAVDADRRRVRLPGR